MMNRKRFTIGARHGVYVLSQHLAVDFVPTRHSRIIRVASGFDFTPLPHRALYDEVLELVFADLDSGDSAFTKAHADQILEVFTRHQEAKAIHQDAHLVVHCQAGISRSTAIACAYAVWSGNAELEEDIRTLGFAVPNSLVYRTIVEGYPGSPLCSYNPDKEVRDVSRS